MRKPQAVVLVAAAIAAVALLVATAAGAAGGVTVKILGGETFKPNTADPPNKLDVDSMRFAPGVVRVKSGSTITWVNRGGEPHTATVVTRRHLPKSASNCGRGCQIAGGHLNDPNDPSKGIKAPVLNAGKPGFDREGDSVAIPPHGKVGIKVSAKRGTTLWYICAVHPWMQGKIVVT
jgi:plastocyanin